MSLRALGSRLLKHGTALIRNTCNQRKLNTTTIGDKINAIQSAAPPSQVTNTRLATPRHFALRNVGVQIGVQARRILIDNVLNRVTNSLAAELRKKAARRILYGDSGPFFAVVGVSLASGTGILTREDELEGVCFEIREAISKIKWHYDSVDVDSKHFEEGDPVTLDDLAFARPIAKGANGLVFPAKLNPMNAVKKNDKIIVDRHDNSISSYPLAVKMMFNYDIQSNAMAILRGMYRETVPARVYYNNVEISDWEFDLSSTKRHLPPHPNIVAMYSVFTDYIREFDDCENLCPAAMPRRIYEEGEGRNMSLFLVMKRYNMSVQDFISKSVPSMRTSILLFTQLLEGVAHLAAHGIAHRDLKSDNLLLDLSDEDEIPILVISDFGCCLTDKSNGLMLPYTSAEIDKGGNAALMAPEIISQKPGTFSVLNYTKSDLWAAGTIAYELFGCVNPFYGSKGQKTLKNVDYKNSDLPELPDQVPLIIRSLVRNLLKRNPNRRLDPDVAANVCQLFLWAPSSWLKPDRLKLPSSAEILQWLLSLTTKILCEGRVNNATFGGENGSGAGRRTYPEYLLISSFLCRAQLSNIRLALSWIREHNNDIELVLENTNIN